MKLSIATAAVATATAAGIHFAVVPQHFREWWAFGAFFVTCGIAQLSWAASPSSVRAGIWGNAALVGLWALSRTGGLPFGPEAGVPEAVGTVDLACVGLEALAVFALVVNRFGGRGEWTPSRTRARGGV